MLEIFEHPNRTSGFKTVNGCLSQPLQTACKSRAAAVVAQSQGREVSIRQLGFTTLGKLVMGLLQKGQAER